MHPCGGCHRDSQSLVFIGILRLARAVQFLPATRSTRNAASRPRHCPSRTKGLPMISDPCPEPQSEIPEIADVESWELSREEQIDAFCAEFQAVLTVFRTTGDRRGETIALSNLGTVYCDLGDFAAFNAVYSIESSELDPALWEMQYLTLKESDEDEW